MKPIASSFSHLNFKTKVRNFQRHSLKEIINSEPLEVTKFTDLINYVSEIYYQNREQNLFFRGQGCYEIDNKTVLLPKIYRDLPERNKGKELKERINNLKIKSDELFKFLGNQWTPPIGLKKDIRYFDEIKWAIIQHYDILETGTPLLDFTSSLHVACSFASLKGNEAKGFKTRKEGMVYVVSLPNYPELISYSPIQGILNIKLLTIGSPEAKRPYFQDGYIAGPFPLTELNNPKRIQFFNFSKRLIAKFKILDNGSFWSDGYQRISENLLYPKDDYFNKLCEEFKKQ